MVYADKLLNKLANSFVIPSKFDRNHAVASFSYEVSYGCKIIICGTCIESEASNNKGGFYHALIVSSKKISRKNCS